MVTMISIATISGSYFSVMLHLSSKFGPATPWNGRDAEPSVNGTQYFTRLLMLRILTPDLTFYHLEYEKIF